MSMFRSTNPNQQSGSSPGSGSDTGGKESFQISAPSISLPKGGGAIRGIGEKFAANPVTGTGSMTVPIATSPGRSGFGPTLTASSTTAAGTIFGVEQAARTTSDAVSLSAPVGFPIVLGGFLLAVLGGLLAGAAGALRAARLRPADALRTVE